MKTLLLLTLLSSNPVSKSPTKAVLFSCFLPAGGQFYNEKYIKGTIIASIELYTGYKTAINYFDYRKTASPERFSDALSYGFYFLGTWLYSMADAYVDAHLYNFKEKMEVSLLPTGVRLSFKLR